jgi:hypothetical protein
MATQGLKLGTAWDADFRSWTDELLLGRKTKKPKQAKGSGSGSGGGVSSWSGTKVSSAPIGDYAGKGSKSDVRTRLMGMAQGGCQVIIKITGGAKNARSVSHHFAYLSRDGELELTDQDGNEVKGEEALKDLADHWRVLSPKLDDKDGRKETFNIVFSMPEGTDARALAEAVRETSKIEFAHHKWVMVQHFDEPQVHAHISVRTESMEGVRLNPRKVDLQRWRETFAFQLRERGVEAEATRRGPRLKQERVNKPWAVTRLEERDQPTNPKPESTTPVRAEAWTTQADRTRELYRRVISSLQQSPDDQDRAIAIELARMVREQSSKENSRESKRSQNPAELER